MTMKEIWARPDYTEIPGVDGKTIFFRTHPMICPAPWCGATFYGYQPVERPFAPYAAPGAGGCPTCGDPSCWDWEQKRQMRMDPAYLNACQDYTQYGMKERKDAGEPSLVPKLVKMGGKASG